MLRTSLLSSLSLLFLYALSFTHAGSNLPSIAFLDKNSRKHGVKTLASGVQYKILTKGTGDSHPAKNSYCTYDYKGTLIDGTEFDSSYERGEPSIFAPNEVIKGWTELMQLMVEGDKWEVYIPSDLGYGDYDHGKYIKGGDTLIFTMELIKINGRKVPARVKDFFSD